MVVDYRLYSDDKPTNFFASSIMACGLIICFLYFSVAEIEELRQKFEVDKSEVERMKAQRKFKPF